MKIGGGVSGGIRLRYEQQASIISDYYFLKTICYCDWRWLAREEYKGRLGRNQQGMRNCWLKIYETILRLFLNNPKDKKALFRYNEEIFTVYGWYFYWTYWQAVLGRIICWILF